MAAEPAPGTAVAEAPAGDGDAAMPDAAPVEAGVPAVKPPPAFIIDSSQAGGPRGLRVRSMLQEDGARMPTPQKSARARSDAARRSRTAPACLARARSDARRAGSRPARGHGVTTTSPPPRTPPAPSPPPRTPPAPRHASRKRHARRVRSDGAATRPEMLGLRAAASPRDCSPAGRRRGRRERPRARVARQDLRRRLERLGPPKDRGDGQRRGEGGARLADGAGTKRRAAPLRCTVSEAGRGDAAERDVDIPRAIERAKRTTYRRPPT